MFFVSVDSKGVSVSISRLFSALARGLTSVDSKGFALHHNSAKLGWHMLVRIHNGVTTKGRETVAKMKKRQQGCRTPNFAELPIAYFIRGIISVKCDFVVDSMAGQVGCRFGGSLRL